MDFTYYENVKGIRNKTLRRLIEIAKRNPRNPKELSEEFRISLATAYDYFNCLKTLKEILAKELDEKIEALKLQILELKYDIEQIKAKEKEKEIRKLLSDLDYFIEERKKRLGY